MQEAAAVNNRSSVCTGGWPARLASRSKDAGGEQHTIAGVRGRGRLQRQRSSEAMQELDDGGYGDEPDGGRGKSVKGLTEVLDDDLGRSGVAGVERCDEVDEGGRGWGRRRWR